MGWVHAGHPFTKSGNEGLGFPLARTPSFVLPRGNSSDNENTSAARPLSFAYRDGHRLAFYILLLAPRLCPRSAERPMSEYRGRGF